MKKSLLAYSWVFVLAVAACAQNGPGSTPGVGGSSSTGSAGTSGSAGVSGNAGTTGGGGSSAGDAGTTGSGGDTSTGSGGSGTGGSSTGGDSTGTAGTTGTAGRGGTTGTGGNVVGSAGTGGNASGGRGGTMGTAGNSGSAGRGGTTGSAGSSGATGTAGTGGAGGAEDLTKTIVPGLDGYYWEVTPSGNTALSGTNYPFGPAGGGCPTGANWDATGYINTKPVLNVKGTTGQKYTINVAIRGVVGTRCYTGGTPASTAVGNPTGQNNTWYAGGKQYNDSIWNTMEIRVAPKVTGQANQTNSAYDIYFTNSFQNSSNWCQKEATYEAKYNASFPVMGGGTINLVTHDTNCRTLSNCGAVENQNSCDTSAARVIDMSGTNPAPMAPFSQPRTASLGGTTFYLQWIYIDVTSVTSP